MTRIQKNVATALAALALGAASAASQAHQGDMEMKKDSAACESAKLSAWFDAQRQLSEGSNEFNVKLPTPEACKGMVASGDKSEGAQAKRVAKAEKNGDER